MRIDCIIMAGGRGERLGGAQKPLIEVCGKPLILRVYEALRRLCRRTLVVYSRHTQGVGDLCRGPMIEAECIRGTGSGYVTDLSMVLHLVSMPVLVAPADMPYLDPDLLEDFIYKALLIGADVVNLASDRGPTGVSLFKRPSGSWASVTYASRHSLLDIDTPEDLREAEEYCI